MKKKRIFDIEEIGFGDELVKKAQTPKGEGENTQVIVNSGGSIHPLEEEVSPVLPTFKPQPPSQIQKKPIRKIRYEAEEFISPVSGRKSREPQVVHVAHGEYRLRGISGGIDKLALEKQEFVEFEETDLERSEQRRVPEEGMNQVHVQNEELVDINFMEELISEIPLEEKEVKSLIINAEHVVEELSEVKEVVEELNEVKEVVEVSNEATDEKSSEVNETTGELGKVEASIEESIKDNSVIENLAKEPWTLLEATGAVHDVDSVLDILASEGESYHALESLLNEGEDYETSMPITPLYTESNQNQVTKSDLEPFQDESFHSEILETMVLDQDEATYYETPDLNLLDEADPEMNESDDWIIEKMEIIEQTFVSFGVKVRLTGEFTQGPTVTQIEIQPELGTKMSKILGLSNDLKLNLSVEELRIEPISGKNTIGIEVPNQNRRLVKLKEVLSRPEFVLHESPLYVGLGEDISGSPTYVDILKMPHGLIAGQTGSGKSVCINTLLISILYKASPEDVRLMLIDPKQVELTPYEGIGHLVMPVITNASGAAAGLKWAVDEMERRYELFARNGVRDITSFNSRRLDFELEYEKLPYIVIIIDELADLMMVSAQEVEDSIMRITQKARAAGIHLIVATQRPTVDVITGTIKSNIPSRIAFAVAQSNDSRVILDENGAQSLLGYGDLLWSQSGSKIKRVQGSYISDDEINRVVSRVKAQGRPKYLIASQHFEKGARNSLDGDPLVKQAIELFLERGYASASALQTKMSIGYNRAARIIDILEQRELISKPQGSTRRREVNITREELDMLFK